MKGLKKLCSFVMAVVLCVGVCVPASAAPASSELDGHYAKSAIERWANHGIITGYASDGTYKPDNDMTRAEMSTFLYRVMDLDPVDGASGFSDVDPDEWYAGYVNACAQAGMVNGYEGTTLFGPNDTATRDMAMTVFARAIGIQPSENTDALDRFPDKDSVEEWAAGYVAALVDQGIVEGVGGETIQGDSKITRGAMMCMLDRGITDYVSQNGAHKAVGSNRDNDSDLMIIATNYVRLYGSFNGEVLIAKGEAGAEIDMNGASINGEVVVQPSNVTIINAPQGTVVKAEGTAEGTTVNGVSVAAGQSVTAPAPTPVSSGNDKVDIERACYGQETPGLATLEESINYNQIVPDESERSTEPSISQDTVTYKHASDFGKTVSLKIELLTPSTAKAGETPLLVWVNGGGFTRSDAASNLSTRLGFAKAGYVVASVQHRVSAVSNFPAPLQDLKAAVRYLKAKSNDFKFDKNKVAVGGNSSGGYYATMLGVTSNVKSIQWPDKSGNMVDTQLDVGDNLNESSAVNAVIDYYGVSDLTIIGSGLAPEIEQSHHSAATTEAILLNGAAAAQKGVGVFDPSMEGKVASASPLTYINSETVPFIIFHGTADTLVSPVASKMLQKRLNDAGVHAERYVIEGAGHGGNQFLQDKTVNRAVSFLNNFATLPISNAAKYPDYSKGTRAYAASDLPTLEEACAGAEDIAVDPDKWYVNQAKDVTYKTVSTSNSYTNLTMHILTPTRSANNTPRPVLYCAQCGGFNKSNPNAMSYLRYAERGYVVAVAEIRVVPQVTMPTPIQDSKAGVRWLRANAGIYNIDPDCIIATGTSAGGYTGVMLGVLGNTTQYNDDIKFDVGDNLDQSSAVQGVLDMYGVSDLTIIGAGLSNYNVHDSESNTEALWVNGTAFGTNPGGSVFDDMKKTAIYSPFTYLDAEDPPYLMFHGTADVIVSPIATMEIYNRSKALGIPAERYSIVGAGHGGWQMSIDRVNKIIDDYMDGIVASTK